METIRCSMFRSELDLINEHIKGMEGIDYGVSDVVVIKSESLFHGVHKDHKDDVVKVELLVHDMYIFFSLGKHIGYMEYINEEKNKQV